MAYKFQMGQAILSGALQQEGNVVVENEAGSTVGHILQSGIVSGSGQLQGASVAVDGAVSGDSLSLAAAAISSAGAVSGVTTLDASGLASLDGGIDVNGAMTVSTAGAVAGVTTLDASGLASLDGGVDVNGNLTISTAGAVAGATSIDGSGALAMGSVKVDDGSTIGTDSDADMMTLTQDSDIAIASDLDFNIAKTAGLQLAGVAVSATAAELNYLDNDDLTAADLQKLADITSTAAELNYLDNDDLSAARIAYLAGVDAGTAAASKAVVLDASSNVTGINQLTASYLSGDGSGITNINVENLDAVGSDMYVQFNQNGEFGANGGFIYDGSGSIGLSGSDAGNQVSEMYFGLWNDKKARLHVEEDDGYILNIQAETVDLSGSDGVAAFLGAGSSFSVLSEHDDTGINIMDPADNEYFSATRTTVSGAGAFEGASLAVDLKADAKGGFDVDGNAVISSARAGSLTSLAVSDLTDGRVLLAGTSGELEDSANLTFDGSALSVTGEISGSGALQAGGSVKFDNLGNALVDVTADLMIIDDGASGAIKTTSLAAYATELASTNNGGLASTAGKLELDLSDLVAGDFSHGSWFNSTFAFVDVNDSDITKKESFADYATKLAGAGLSANDGVLSTQAQAVSYDFNAGVDISEGYNVYTGSANISVGLPASAGLTKGDVFVVKQNASGEVTIVCDGSDLIDGESSIVLESPYAAVSILYTGVANTFRLV